MVMNMGGPQGLPTCFGNSSKCLLWEFVEGLVEVIDEHDELDRAHYRPVTITGIVIVANLIVNKQELPLFLSTTSSRGDRS